MAIAYKVGFRPTFKEPLDLNHRPHSHEGRVRRLDVLKSAPTTTRTLKVQAVPLAIPVFPSGCKASFNSSRDFWGADAHVYATPVLVQRTLGAYLGPPVVPTFTNFWEGPPTKIDKKKIGTSLF